MRRLFDEDPFTRTRRIFHGQDDGGFVMETAQDVAPVVEDAKGRFNMFDERSGWKGDMHRVASIPTSVWFALTKEQREDPAFIKRFLNDPDNKVFRVRPGKV